MASTSTIQRDVDTGLPMAQPPAVPATSDAAPEGEGDPEGLADIFSLKWQTEGMPETEFNNTYPPDPWGEEAAPNARVWKIYRDRETASHKAMLHGWNKTLDVLLIFAALFSAVLTAFIIESYKALQPDYTGYVAAFLYAAAVSYNSTGGVFPVLDTIVAPDRFIQTSIAQRWTNGLWFSSLVISLAVALLCILIKQWLDEYDSHVSSATASQKYWAQRYCMYHRGINKWGVPGLISCLPLLLHVALFLFFVGLILFLRPLDGAIFYSLLGMVSCIGTFYLLSLFLPLWRLECPSYTPLLAQALLVVSRAISCLSYVVRVLQRASKHSDLDERGEPRHEASQLYATQRITRESRTIAKCDKELDGYVLSTLIDLPTDGNWDVINTAFASLGAVTSTRTTGVITRKVPWTDIEDKINICFRDIPSTGTGFSITAHAQLRRAREVLCIQSSSGSPVIRAAAYAPGLRSSLGIDGLLLQALGVEDADGRRFDISVLIRRLQSLPLAGDSSYGFPLRSTCLLVMESYSRSNYCLLQSLPEFLLVFCAGRFVSADTHECFYALRIVETMLTTRYNITLPLHNGAENDYICAVVSGLWSMLAGFLQNHIDTLTAQMVAHQALTYFDRATSSSSGFAWAQLPGMSDFVQSYFFDRCVGDSLGKYIALLRYSRMLDHAKVPLEDYWTCVATLLYLGWNCAERPDETGYLSDATNLFPVDPSHWRTMSRLSMGGRYATQDDWYEPALSAFLDGSNPIAGWTWKIARPSLQNDIFIEGLVDLARRIAIVLCRRQRLGRANDTFIPGFFSGPFLLALFREHISRTGSDSVDDLAKHCMKLSPERFKAMCTQLEESGDAGTLLEVCSPQGATQTAPA